MPMPSDGARLEKGVSHGGALQSFDAPETEQVTTFETGELTALCPFQFGGPDFYDLKIRYVADDSALESKSLKQWLETYRSKELTAERLADEIYRVVHGEIAPESLYVRLEQARRGGIEETVEVGDCELRR